MKRGGDGATHSRIISWGMSASQRGSGGWRFACHGTTTRTIGWLPQPSGRGGAHWLKSYLHDRQCFPLKLSQGKETEQTKTFSHLVTECVKPELRKRQGNDWISDKTWALVGRRTALRRVGKLSCTEGRQTKHLIWASLCDNRVARKKGFGKSGAGKGGRAGSIPPHEGVVPGGVRDRGIPLPSDNGATDGGAGGTLLAAGFPW
jgi:hypothetical protein